MVTKSLKRLSWFTLAYVLLVILWGAFVRATGSGAGCGAHWPLCNGTPIPRSATLATIIEFTHRLTSGLTLVFILWQAIWVFKSTLRGDWRRRLAVLSCVLIVVEAGIGASLVLLELVAHNSSMWRAGAVALHLGNTFLLTGALGSLAWALQQDEGTRRVRSFLTLPGFITLALLCVGATGAVVALGDTLFPSADLATALAQDFSGSAHILVRLRGWHPLLAILVAVGMMKYAFSALQHHSGKKLAAAVIGLLLTQIFLGALNILLLAPVALQLMHLAVAQMLWICWFLLFYFTLSVRVQASAVESPASWSSFGAQEPQNS